MSITRTGKLKCFVGGASFGFFLRIHVNPADVLAICSIHVCTNCFYKMIMSVITFCIGEIILNIFY